MRECSEFSPSPCGRGLGGGGGATPSRSAPRSTPPAPGSSGAAAASGRSDPTSAPRARRTVQPPRAKPSCLAWLPLLSHTSMTTCNRPLTTGNHVTHRDEIRRHLRRRPRLHPQRRDSREARGRGGERGRGRGLRHGGRHQPARRLVPGPVAAARRARIRHGGGNRRAGHHRPAGHLAAGDRRRGALLAGLADPDPDRQRRTARRASPASRAPN